MLEDLIFKEGDLKKPLKLKGFDYKLLPFVLQKNKRKTLFVFEDSIVDCYDNLSLFFGDSGVFFDASCLEKGGGVDGFLGWSGETKDLFLKSLSSGFKNHQFIAICRSLYNKKIFPLNKVLDEVVLTKNTSYDFLIKTLSELGYERVDFVGSRGEFSVRGFVVDFFPFDFSSPVRCLFDDDEMGLFVFNPSSQRTKNKLSSFVLIKASIEKSLFSIDRFLPSDFLLCYITPNSVCFNSFDPKKTKALKVSSVSASDCVLSKKGFIKTDVLASVGCFYKKTLFVPRWLVGKGVSTPPSSDVYIDFSTLGVGDYLIHEDFGVGKYLGLKEVDGGGEFLVLCFSDGKVSVFPKYFDKISFFKDSKHDCVLGSIKSSKSWKNRVLRYKKNISFFVEDLVKTHVERQKVVSDLYYLDKDIELSFLEKFPFKDTQDQHVCWGEIKNDLLSKAPMDRLLCGDVGFGKTELAIRSVFVASVNGFSSIVLAPTTVLAKQLFNAFTERLSLFDISVGCVSRFIKKTDHKKTIGSFIEGKIDVLVGTHSIIRDVDCLRKASLVVVDDEHRFGVEQKEIVKNKNPKVNMLYMSATPIPRTLKLALSDFKGLSLLSSPPVFKRPTKTFVDVFSKKTIKRVVFFEVSRGGQVLFINNNIKTMDKVVSLIKKLLPFVSVDFIHGKENSFDLEQKMDLFINKKIDVLVASTIVECGINIPSVNSIIINDSHLFGVSQLYQMRGRVGRSSSSSFAYLFVPQKHSLSTVSKKRLKTIEKNASLGSCYSVSLEDLNIRGGGTLFGHKQSGGADVLGVELYSKILTETVSGFYKKPLYPTPVVSFYEKSFIPPDFIPSVKMRVWFYKELSQTSLETLFLFVEKCVDMFGPFPPTIKTLIKTRRVFLLSSLLYFSHVNLKKDVIEVSLVSSFWKNKTGVLFEGLSVFNFKFTHNGERFCVFLGGLKIFNVFDELYNRLQHDL